MEFKSLRNIESSFRQLRLFGMIFLAACTVVTVWSVWSSYSFAEKQREKIYVLDGGKSLMLALSQDLSQNRPAEAREHVRRFHELFFTLAPEKSAIESNVQRALVMADKSAYNYYRDFAEQGFYNRIIAGNINQTVRVDSVVCDFDSYPYRVRTFAKQTIIRESNVTERTLVTECRLEDAGDGVPTDELQPLGRQPQRLPDTELHDHREQGHQNGEEMKQEVVNAKQRIVGGIKERLDALSPQQRLHMVVGMFGILVVLLLFCILQTVTDIADRPENTNIVIEHIERPVIVDRKHEYQQLKEIANGTGEQRESGADARRGLGQLIPGGADR